MAITSEKTNINEDGQDKPALVISVTNGALEQLEDLKRFIGAEDTLEVVKVGIALIQKLKEEKHGRQN